MAPRRYVLHEANYRQLLDYQPNVAVLPWGATEAHNYHLPYGTDVTQVAAVAERAVADAHDRGAKPVLLPTVPFGHNTQQLDQVATISIGHESIACILRDVARSLARQGIDRLVVVNGHGGNEFKPFIRDIQDATGVFIVRVDFWQTQPELHAEVFEAPGSHADEMETSMMLHLAPEWVVMAQAGPGEVKPYTIDGISQPGVWTPVPWGKACPDTGSGDPSPATAEKGERFVAGVADALARLLVGLSHAQKGDLPYV